MIGADRYISNKSDEVATLHATQRYQRGFSDIDMWNLDVLLADVIVYGCQYHIDLGKSSPWHMDNKQWHDTLVTIRNGFARRDVSGAPNPPKKAWKLLRKHFGYLWD